MGEQLVLLAKRSKLFKLYVLYARNLHRIRRLGSMKRTSGMSAKRETMTNSFGLGCGVRRTVGFCVVAIKHTVGGTYSGSNRTAQRCTSASSGVKLSCFLREERYSTRQSFDPKLVAALFLSFPRAVTCCAVLTVLYSLYSVLHVMLITVAMLCVLRYIPQSLSTNKSIILPTTHIFSSKIPTPRVWPRFTSQLVNHF